MTNVQIVKIDTETERQRCNERARNTRETETDRDITEREEREEDLIKYLDLFTSEINLTPGFPYNMNKVNSS